MYDFLVRGTANDPAIRFVYAGTTQLCSDAIIAHNCTPMSGRIFADALSTTTLLSVLLDGNEKYSLKFDYSGAVGTILCDVNGASEVRGLISNTNLDGENLSLDYLFGEKDIPITLIKFDGGKVLNSGTVLCSMASPSDDVAMFFALSDQIESEIVTFCELRPDPTHPVLCAGAFMIQAMPGCDLERFNQLREDIKRDNFGNLLFQFDLPFEKQLKKMLNALDLKDLSYTLSNTPQFKCSCSKSSMKRALLTLGKEELNGLFSEQDEVTLRCQFCNKSYSFVAEEFN